MDMRAELKRLHYSSGATTIYVTHDQVEALTMSSNIAVMREGVIQQMDTPDRIYHYPSNVFIADFIGNPKVNLIDGMIDGHGSVNMGDFSLNMDTRDALGNVVVAIRPEDITITTNPIPGGVEFLAYSVLPAGSDTTIVAKRGDTELNVKEMGISKFKMDDKIWLQFDSTTLNLFSKETGNIIANN
jgi:multiple sugar transport system ATP-binding protein